MCCGKFDLTDAELQALTKPEKRARIGRRPLLKGLGAAGLLATFGYLGLRAPQTAAEVELFQDEGLRKLRKCFGKYVDCHRGGGSASYCDLVAECCLEEEFPPDIRSGDLVNPFCRNGKPDIRLSPLINAPDIRAALDPLHQLMTSRQPLPIDQSGPVLLRGLDALFEVRHRAGQETRNQQAAEGLGVEINAEAKQTCGSQFSHSMFVSWRVYGGRPPVQINIEITDPSGKKQRMTGAASEGMTRFDLGFPGGGSASVLVTAQDAGNSTASGQSSVQLGKCQ
jgi:hypothetical protein